MFRRLRNDKSDEDEEEKLSYTKAIGNEIYFCGDITPENTLEFIEAFKKLEIQLLKHKAELVGYEPEIRVYIMSDGGDVYSGFALKNTIENARVNVTTIAQGSCCSAATFMFLGGKKRLITKNGYLLIHQISTEFWGEYKDLKNEMKICNKIMKDLKKMYMEKTNIPEDKFKKLMKKDLYLSASKCLKYEIAHGLDE